jgi:hypothetical protein
MLRNSDTVEFSLKFFPTHSLSFARFFLFCIFFSPASHLFHLHLIESRMKNYVLHFLSHVNVPKLEIPRIIFKSCFLVLTIRTSADWFDFPRGLLTSIRVLTLISQFLSFSRSFWDDLKNSWKTWWASGLSLLSNTWFWYMEISKSSLNIESASWLSLKGSLLSKSLKNCVLKLKD